MAETVLQPEAPAASRVSAGRWIAVGDATIRSLGPIVLALAVGAVIIAALGRNPGSFYGDIVEGGLLRSSGWQNTIIRMAPLLLIAAGLVVVFRANLWNLGIDGQFLLAAVIISGVGPALDASLPNGFTLLLLWLLAGAVGATWTFVPAFLRAWYGVNEIITTLMMTFIGIGVANLFIKGPFRDFESTNVPQTPVLPLEDRLPLIPGTRISIAIILAFAAVLVVHYVMTRTSFGLRLNVLGANPRAAAHFGLRLKRLIMVSFAVSGLLIGFAAAAEILGLWGYVRADWNPAFGLIVVPLVFLARLNALAVIPFVWLLATLSIGGDVAARRSDLPTDFLLVLVGLILLFMAVTEYLGRRRALGQSYLTAGLAEALRKRREP
jgi:general nucleoside transport system permease protein